MSSCDVCHCLMREPANVTNQRLACGWCGCVLHVCGECLADMEGIRGMRYHGCPECGDDAADLRSDAGEGRAPWLPLDGLAWSDADAAARAGPSWDTRARMWAFSVRAPALATGEASVPERDVRALGRWSSDAAASYARTATALGCHRHLQATDWGGRTGVKRGNGVRRACGPGGAAPT